MLQIPAAALSDVTVLAAYVIFAACYFVFALGKFPGLKIDRPGAAIIGAVGMVAFRIVPARDALRFIDFPTLVLLLDDAHRRHAASGRLLRVECRDSAATAATFAPTARRHLHFRNTLRTLR